jgi:hypothetical protein
MVRRGRQCTQRKSHGGMENRADQMDLKLLLDEPPWDWPRDAGKRFHKILTDNKANESDRLIAAELAGNLTVMNEALAEALLGIVGDAGLPEELRATAAISLGPVLEHADTSEFDDYDDVAVSEQTFHRIQLTLRKIYLDESVPVLVRRRILEASVRAAEDWHRDAISHAYSIGDRDWMLTAVFAMERVRGFDDQILEALKSSDPEIHYEAVSAAGNWEMAAAWEHVAGLVHDAATPKPLLLAAIVAVASIRPGEAREMLDDLTGSDDEEIAEAAEEAILMASAGGDSEDEEEDEDDWIN